MRKLNVSLSLIVICSVALLGYTAPASAKKPVHAASASLLAVSPSAPVVADALVFSGCGYTADSSLTIVVYAPGYAAFFGAATDVSGCFDTAATENYTADVAGDYQVDAYQADQVVATIHFTVS
jgi:hypothetical protein